MSLRNSCKQCSDLDAEEAGRQPFHLLSGSDCRAVVSALIRARFQLQKGMNAASICWFMSQ